MRPNISNSHALPGTLLVFEGPDGAGKSTQIQAMKKLLEKEGKTVIVSEWKNAPVISSFLKNNEQLHKIADRILPETSLFLQSADLLYRIEREIIPALKQGHIVLMDRGYQTLIVRGLMIGMSETQLKQGLLWWRNTLYKELFDKSHILYFTVNTEESLNRLELRTLEEQKHVYGKKFRREKFDGTLLAMHFINTLIYAPDGSKMTRNDKKNFIRQSQQQIVETYKLVFQDESAPYTVLDGMLDEQKLSRLLKKRVIDMFF